MTFKINSYFTLITLLLLLNQPLIAEEGSSESSQDSVTEEVLETPTFNSKFDEIFKDFVDENGMVDYASLRRKRSKLIALAREIEDLKVEDYLTWEDADQVAFWINTHNFYLLKLIIENYPIEPSRWKLIFYPANSIMHIKNARTDHFFNIMGREYNLKELEEYIGKLYEDPRVYFTISYASMSSAVLRNEAYKGQKFEEQIDDQIRKFLKKPEALKISNEDETIYLTDIFNWYKKDFLKTYHTDERYRTRNPEIRAYFNFLSQFAPKDAVPSLSRSNYEVKFMRYDWHLNEAPNSK